MILKNELIFYIIVFVIIYTILLIDNKVNNYKNNISYKVPIIFTLFTILINKFYGLNVFNYCYNLSKQDIIIEMVDF